MTHNALTFVRAFALLVLGCATLRAGEPIDEVLLRRALDRPIMNGSQTLAEVQDYAESRVARMPELKNVEQWETDAERLRQQVLDQVVFRGEAKAWRQYRGRVEWLDRLPGGPGYVICKLRFEALPGLWIPALLYEPDPLPAGGKLPVMINVNGHEPVGKAAENKQIRCINQAKRGILALNLEWLGMGQLRSAGFTHDRINAIDLCGTSGLAVHFLAMQRALDLMLEHPQVDAARVGVTGLSGGGWQTIFFSPLDPRVTLACPVAGYSSYLTRIRHFSDLGDNEQTPTDLATLVDYTHLTAMLAPHPTLLTFNQRDSCCFAAPHAMPPLVEAAAPVFSLFDREDALRVHVNLDPGDHNYGADNRQALYRLLRDNWFGHSDEFNASEIPCEYELKTAEELAVDLPADNLDLHGLALKLAETVPEKSEQPIDAVALPAWRDSRRERLRTLVKPLQGDVTDEKLGEETSNGLITSFHRLRINTSWTVPAVRIAPPAPTGKVLVIADGGRKATFDRVKPLLEQGRDVVVLDPFYFGEAVPSERDYLWALMVSTVGGRPLGLQAGQVAAVARWFQQVGAVEKPVIVTDGPRSGVVALIAAAIEPEAIAGVESHNGLGSLRDVLRRKLAYREAPELFCFGLLAEFDLDSIAELIAPRPVQLDAESGPSP